MLPPHVKEFYRKAEADLDGFWEEAALNARHDLHWFKMWDKVFEHNYPTFKWYVGGKTNICYSAVDFKVKMGKGAKAALIYENGDTGEVRTVTQPERRLEEAVRLGFTTCVIPEACREGLRAPSGARVEGVKDLSGALDIALA